MIRIDSNIAPEEEILKPTAFPDGTKLLKFDPRRDEYTITWLYDSDDETMLEIIADCISKMSKQCNQILTMFYYEEKTLDDIMTELSTFESKNALKTRKYKCMEELRKSAKSIYRRYLNS